jgi:uncharacterized protein
MSANAAATPPGGRQPEPSMEEILASIRRIIADDTLGTKKDEPIPVTVSAAPAPAPVMVEPDPIEDDFDADVLDLAEVATVAAAPQVVDVNLAPEDDFSFDLPEPVVQEMDMSAFAPTTSVATAVPLNSVQAIETEILSAHTGSLVNQAFQSLSRNAAMPAAGRSIEASGNASSGRKSSGSRAAIKAAPKAGLTSSRYPLHERPTGVPCSGTLFLFERASA